jgi:hypothetical protein
MVQLPLPYLKVGYLTAPPANNAIAPHTDWERSQFVLNHEGLQQVYPCIFEMIIVCSLDLLIFVSVLSITLLFESDV